MATISHQALAPEISLSAGTKTWFGKFIAWCEAEEKERMFWVGLSLTLHGCLITPLTFLSALLMGHHFALMVTAMFSMVAVLVVNLAAMPTKITIPIFFASILLDIAIIATCLLSLLNG